MKNFIGSSRQSLREAKNKFVENYFQLSITLTQSPYKILLRNDSYKILFLLSHMRSGSSLLTHILGSNPEIIGYGETHIQYFSEEDVQQLMLKIYLNVPEFRRIKDLKNFRMNHRYILDKVLHNNKFLDHSFLTSENIYVIFLLREPQRTLNSILDLKSHWSEEKALLYYSDRLKNLEMYAQIINNLDRAFFLTYEQLLNSTDLVLEKLQVFLKTEHPFTENYKVFKTTGQPGVGDSKENIKAGQILRHSRELSTHVSSTSIELAEKAFRDCVRTLSNYCCLI
ncbi:MAG: sulfotransferase [Leptolyngbyaceae cyanobacterium SM1_4_3]|nr:sulfotransferase [Leptolyngbyaceae cyanobacterium SM1_4_3]